MFTREQLEAMPQHTQFLLMNASKSTDMYAEYAGVPMETLLKPMVLTSAKDVTVLSPDGFGQIHPFEYDPNPSANCFVRERTLPQPIFTMTPPI